MKRQPQQPSRPIKTPTTPGVASKVQSITAKSGDGRAADWTRRLQRTAAQNFGQSGQRGSGQKRK
jgi:hypothetical protein